MLDGPIAYIVVSLAVALVGFAKGGFAGLGAAAMPLIVLVMDPIQGAAMLLPILLVQDVISVWAFRREFDAATLKLMLPGAIIGIFLGWWLAASVSADAVRAIVGLIALLFGANRLLAGIGWAVQIKGALPNWLGMFWGGVSGFTSQIAHAGGPPFQIWALTRHFPHTIFIGTSSIFFAAVNWQKVPAYAALGQFTWINLKLSLLFLPLAIASTYGGVWLVRRIAPERFHLIINILMIIVGAELIRKAMMG